MALAYTFEVTLLEVKPRLWRRFLLHEKATFAELHDAIQRACGWEDSHMYHFLETRRGPLIATRAAPRSGEPDAAKIDVRSVLGARGSVACFYEYDFGDSWMHEVKLVERAQLRAGRHRELLDGGGAFPPEDCGGPVGYVRCVAAASEKRWKPEFGDETERRELLEWLGGWKPDAFDLAAAKRVFDR